MIKRIIVGFIVCFLSWSAYAQGWLPLTTPFTGGTLDSFTASLFEVHAAKKVLTSYTGPLYQIRRDSDNLTLDVTPSTSDGWPSKPLIIAWLNGANGYVSKVYGQFGRNDCVSSVAVAQPWLDLNGTHPVFYWDGASAQILDCTTPLASFSQNSGGISIVAVRINLVTLTAVSRSLIFVSTTNAALTRMAMGADSATSKTDATGRRLDANSIARTTGFTNDTSWATEIGRWNWTAATLAHQMGAQSETLNPFQTAGSTSNTASGNVSIGNSNAGASPFNGKITLVAWYSTVLSDGTVTSLLSALSALQVSP